MRSTLPSIGTISDQHTLGKLRPISSALPRSAMIGPYEEGKGPLRFGEAITMPQRVTMDPMIRREDFAREVSGQSPPDIIRELNVSLLLPTAFVRRLLRKPEFQRETNY